MGGVASVHSLAFIDIDQIADVGGNLGIAGAIEEDGSDVSGSDRFNQAGDGRVRDGIQIDAWDLSDAFLGQIGGVALNDFIEPPGDGFGEGVSRGEPVRCEGKRGMRPRAVRRLTGQ